MIQDIESEYYSIIFSAVTLLSYDVANSCLEALPISNICSVLNTPAVDTTDF